MRPVVWSDEARRDYLAILQYIARENPYAAERVVDAIEAAAKNLGAYATRRPGRVAGTYEKLVTRLPYIMAYALSSHADGEGVIVLRVIHASMDWSSGTWPARDT